jgi:hypothetical protein
MAMAKYYFILFLVMGGVLYYVFLEDPCNQNIKADFSREHPDYKILDSGSREGSPDEVQCHIRYQKPDGDQAYEDVWLYQKTESGWHFASALAKEKAVQAP